MCAYRQSVPQWRRYRQSPIKGDQVTRSHIAQCDAPLRENDGAGGAVVDAVVAAMHLQGEVAGGAEFVNNDGDIE
jgi:hypothetical protein